MLLGIRWRSLLVKIIAWSFVPTAIILAAVALVGFFAYQRVAEDLVIERNRELVRRIASQLAIGLEEYPDDLAAVARTADISSNLLSTQRAALSQARSQLAAFDAGVVLLDNHGVVVAAEPPRPEVLGRDWSNRAYFVQMVRSPGPVFSDVTGDGPGGVRVVAVAVPVYGARGEFVGALAGMFRLGATSVSSFYGDIVKLRIGAGDSAFINAYLVDHYGRVIYHGDAQHIGDDFSDQSAVQQLVNGQSGAFRTRDVAGRDIVASFSPVPGTPWGLVSEVSWNLVLSASRDYGRFLLLLLALGVVIPAIVVAVGANRITQPIRDLTRAAQQVAGGKFGQTVAAPTGDELEELAGQFNLMSAKLAQSYAALQEREERFSLAMQGANDGLWDWDLKTNQVYYSPRWKSMLGYQKHEVEPAFSAWERLVHPDDRQPAMKVVEAFVAGEVDKFDTEFRMRHKDGHYVNVLSRAFGVRQSPQGPIVRLVGTHIDITERKRAEQQIRRQNEYLAALHETTLGVVRHLDIQELLEAMVERAVKLVSASEGWVYLVRPDKQDIESVVETGKYRKYIGLRHKPGEGIAGRIWQSGQPLAVENYTAWPGRSQQLGDEQIGPAIGMPLKFGSEVVGVIGLTRTPEAPLFSQDETDLMSRFAQLASIALENAQLHTSLQEQLGERARAQQALQERLAFEKLVTTISTNFINLATDEIDQGIRQALQTIGEFTGVDHACVFLLSKNRTSMQCAHEWRARSAEPPPHSWQDATLGVLPWFDRKIMRLEVVHIPCIADLPPEASASRAAFQAQGIQSLLAIPMAYRGSAVGFLGLGSGHTGKTWSDQSIALLRIVSEIFVNALEHKRAQEALHQAYQTLERRVEERTRELSTLNAVAAVASRSLDLQGIMNDALDKTMQAMGMECGAAYDIDESDRAITLIAHRGLSREFVESLSSMPLQVALGGKDLDLDQPVTWTMAEYPEGNLKKAIQREGLRLVAGAPLIAKGRFVGSLVLGSRASRSLAPNESSLLMAIGQQIGIAIENARLYKAAQDRHQEAERRRQVAEGLRETLAVLNSRQSLDDTLDYIVSQACHLMNCDAASLFRLESEGGPLKVQATCGLDAGCVSALSMPVGKGGAGRALARRTPVILPDARALTTQLSATPDTAVDSELPALEQLISRQYLASLSVPLIVKDETYGAITLYYHEAHEFSEEETRLALSIANQAALAIESARLREQAEQSAAVAERTRLARELHDSVTQSLYSVTLYAEAAARLLTTGQHLEAAGHLRELRDTAQEALREMRLLIFELRPLALEKSGLAAALQARLEAVEGRGGMQIEFQVEGAILEQRVPFVVQEELYQIAREALNNVLKHAQARRVGIHLQLKPSCTNLLIFDDGIGFNPSQAREGGRLGLSGMQERAQKIGATLQINSSPGQGARVLVTVPTPPGAPEI